MARPLRVAFAGGLYHVTARGNERKTIARDDTDRTCFVDTVAASLALVRRSLPPLKQRDWTVLVQGLDLRAESDADFKALLDGAADPYATLRSVYQQSRQAEIAEIKGKKAQLIDFEDPLADPDAPKATPPAGAPPASGTEKIGRAHV